LVQFTQATVAMGPVTTAVLDDTCGNLIQIAWKQILRLTTPDLHPKEQRPLFGNPGTEKRSGPRSLRMTAYVLI
jgi:hypothetical protein